MSKELVSYNYPIVSTNKITTEYIKDILKSVLPELNNLIRLSKMNSLYNSNDCIARKFQPKDNPNQLVYVYTDKSDCKIIAIELEQINASNKLNRFTTYSNFYEMKPLSNKELKELLKEEGCTLEELKETIEEVVGATTIYVVHEGGGFDNEPRELESVLQIYDGETLYVHRNEGGSGTFTDDSFILLIIKDSNESVLDMYLMYGEPYEFDTDFFEDEYQITVDSIKDKYKFDMTKGYIISHN